MRHIGSFTNEAQARFFTDFLLSRDIRSQLEPEADRTWSVWIRDEDQIAEAQSALERFQANPTAPEFQKAPEEAARARRAEAEDLEKYRRRIRSRQSLFLKFGRYSIGPLTFTLILVCVYVAIFSRLGANEEWLRGWQISDPESMSHQFLPEVLHGEVWRLFTPIFIHFGLLHILFNMLWFYELGSMVEARQSSLFLLGFIAVSAALSNVAQYYFTGPNFGGMSGVVYALGGYVWIRGRYDRSSGLYLSPQNVAILIVWLVFCFSPLMRNVANYAHFAGLVIGMAWGGAAALMAARRPE